MHDNRVQPFGPALLKAARERALAEIEFERDILRNKWVVKLGSNLPAMLMPLVEPFLAERDDWDDNNVHKKEHMSSYRLLETLHIFVGDLIDNGTLVYNPEHDAFDLCDTGLLVAASIRARQTQQ